MAATSIRSRTRFRPPKIRLHCRLGDVLTVPMIINNTIIGSSLVQCSSLFQVPKRSFSKSILTLCLINMPSSPKWLSSKQPRDNTRWISFTAAYGVIFTSCSCQNLNERGTSKWGLLTQTTSEYKKWRVVHIALIPFWGWSLHLSSDQLRVASSSTSC